MPARETPTATFGTRLAVVLAAVAALRGACLYQTLSDPLLSDLLILDSRIYDGMAARIAGGDGLAGSEVFALGPLYMYFLAGLRAVFGGGTAPVYAVQLGMGLANVAWTASLARRVFGERAALWAAAGIGLYGAMAMLELKVMGTTLAVALSLAGLRALIAARDRGWRAGMLAPGALLGLACLARPNTLLFVPLAALWIAWEGARPAARRAPAALAFALGAALAIAPAAARNYAVSGQWVWISSQGGLTFYQANNERARGLYTRLPGFVGSPTAMRAQAREKAEAELGRAVSDAEASRYWTRRGLAFLFGDPARAAALVARKLGYWLGSDEHSTEYVLPVERASTPALWALWLPFGALLGLAVLGARCARWRDPTPWLLAAFAAANLVSVLAFYFSSRYRMPAVPVVAVFAGAGAAGALERWRESARAFARWTAPGWIAAALSLVSWSDHLAAEAAQQHYNFAQVLRERGELAAAVAHYRSAIEPFPDRWMPRLGLAQAREGLGERDAALREYERVLALRPGQPLAARRAAALRADGAR